MKIAILSFYSGHVERGVENWSHELGKRLAKKHDVVIFQNGSKLQNARYKEEIVGLKVNWEKEYSNIRLSRVFFLDYWSLTVTRFTLHILSALFRGNFDIIIPTNGGWQVAFIRILTWVKRKKMVIVGHAGNGWDDINNLWSFPDIFVALSERTRKWAKRINPLAKVQVIPDGVDLSVFKPSGEKINIKLEKPVILAVSALQTGKRLKLAIKAVSQLKKGSLLILGGGQEHKNLQKLGKDLLGNRFSLKLVKHKEIPKYYRSCYLFTLPSWPYEAFGIVYLEAMASGLPVVATDDELRREIVGYAGILVDPTDVDAYAKALKQALEKNWGDRPRKQAEKFSWDKVVKHYEELFESLVQ